jgi:NADH-quinone oxidoreductase subunit J
MTVLFYASAAVATVGSLLAVTRTKALHALIYLILALFAVALCFLSLGAPFVAALEVIVYAGAIMVLILFVIMMLNLGPESWARERRLLPRHAWLVPTIMAGALVGLTLVAILGAPQQATQAASVGPKAVGVALFSTYLIGVELASVLLLVGLVGAYYLGAKK